MGNIISDHIKHLPLYFVISYQCDKYVQWAPLNGIMDNGINRLMESNLSRFTSPKLVFHN
jgi:hypothetical protein